VTNASVWARSQPNDAVDPIAAVPNNTEVNILNQQGEWAEIEWSAPGGLLHGWIPIQWLDNVGEGNE
jgi:hypothetical protein